MLIGQSEQSTFLSNDNNIPTIDGNHDVSRYRSTNLSNLLPARLIHKASSSTLCFNIKDAS